MENLFKPPGYTSVAPYLVVDGVERTLDFLEKVFGAARLRVIPGGDGKILHGEARVDDTVVMLSDGAPGWPPIASHVHIYLRDVDDAYARALAAGAESIQAPCQKGDGDRRAGVRDSGGTTWWIATQVG